MDPPSSVFSPYQKLCKKHSISKGSSRRSADWKYHAEYAAHGQIWSLWIDFRTSLPIIYVSGLLLELPFDIPCLKSVLKSSCYIFQKVFESIEYEHPVPSSMFSYLYTSMASRPHSLWPRKAFPNYCGIAVKMITGKSVNLRCWPCTNMNNAFHLL